MLIDEETQMFSRVTFIGHFKYYLQIRFADVNGTHTTLNNSYNLMGMSSKRGTGRVAPLKIHAL